ncbi:hypothetical protein JAAARDRAFT_43997 [Jaapia argillacea MUCL 33604]|uniref:Yeast cell wall synthesis Kre9/Knh1-like N-terminal domain-containing protein n=1 Tax=Jaapia argillacea MUCL 33604 TaxID=933084 RepID=A0A067QHB4_9AGAM|nr:hypothetical protein JAAARDRAFT_43997 [Jaapia argillacea MUCL 33604]
MSRIVADSTNDSTLALLLPFATALTLSTPTGLTSGGPATVNWTATTTDVPFSLELVNTLFHNSFAIGNNLQPGLGTYSFTMPTVPIGDGYTLEAVNISNINQIYASSGDFAIAQAPSTTASSTGSSTSTGLPPTVSASMTSPLSTPSSGSTGSSAPSASTTAFNSGALAKFSSSTGTYAAMLLGAVAGAAMIL